MQEIVDQADAVVTPSQIIEIIEEQELQADAYHNCCKIVQTD